jgi:hypothetical protein
MERIAVRPHLDAKEVHATIYRSLKLDRSSNVVEISDSYFLTEPVSDITLNLVPPAT